MNRDDLLALGEMPQDVDRVLARRLADCLRVMDGAADELPDASVSRPVAQEGDGS
jgi:hypothetical protein